MSDETRYPEEVQTAEVGDEFRVCPSCGYENGFHIMFRPSGSGDSLDWWFICPNCSSHFDLGLKVHRD
jgi:hypothetical protein